MALADALLYSNLLISAMKSDNDCNANDDTLHMLDAETLGKIFEVTLRFLEDEDEEVRHSACSAVLSAVYGVSHKPKLVTEVVIKLAFASFISGMKSKSAPFFAKLFQHNDSDTNNKRQPGRYIFDAEDHPRREPTLIAQIATQAVVKYIENEEEGNANTTEFAESLHKHGVSIDEIKKKHRCFLL